jgi:hypothetical protein
LKKLLSLLTSFLLGFVFFMGGAAVATGVTGPASNDQASEEQVSVDAPAPSGETTNPGSSSSGDTYCFEIGKADELGGDCFCVQDDVSDMAEVDCLIASGLVPASSRASYLQELQARGDGTGAGTNSGSSTGPSGSGASGDTYCFEIGKDNELGGDCFCVQDSVTDMVEVDCLIASGIVPAESRESYLRYLEQLTSNP